MRYWGRLEPTHRGFSLCACEIVVLLNAVNGPSDCYHWNLICGFGLLFLIEIRPDSLPVSSDIRAACVIYLLSWRRKDALSSRMFEKNGAVE